MQGDNQPILTPFKSEQSIFTVGVGDGRQDGEPHYVIWRNGKKVAAIEDEKTADLVCGFLNFQMLFEENKVNSGALETLADLIDFLRTTRKAED